MTESEAARELFVLCSEHGLGIKVDARLKGKHYVTVAGKTFGTYAAALGHVQATTGEREL